MYPSMFRTVAMLCLAFVSATWALAQQPVEGGKKIAEQNRQFQDKALDLEMWKNRFEVESREVYAHRDALVAALKLKPGQRVADVGAGTGAFMAAMLKQVADSGHYFAVDISPRFLELIRERAETGKHANVTTVLGAITSITLPANSVDAVFICDTYHHFEKPEPVLASIHKAMKKGGTLVVVDFIREPGKSSAFSLEHIRASQAVFRKEIETAGFAYQEDVKVDGLKENYVMRFVKP
ncbi:MAG: methyltransferase domain-containing protein [Blastocatellia bacterium]|nr:methyltransferase domain-containing protein [Blastocatellia bacterium]